jgi:putative oxidoreductase
MSLLVLRASGFGFISIKLQTVTPHGAVYGSPGYECDLLYIACIIALALLLGHQRAMMGVSRRYAATG